MRFVSRIVLRVPVFEAQRTNGRYLSDVLAGLCPVKVPCRRQGQPLHQNSRERGRAPCHRGRNLRRRSGQCHSALLCGAIRRSRRSLPPRRGAPHRGGAEPSSNLRRLTFCQPLGRCGQWQDPGRAHQPARHCDRAAHLQGVFSVARFGALPARSQFRCPGPATSLGQYRHQGPNGL